MILNPLGARIIVKRKIIQKVGGVIIVPKNSEEMKSNIGEVVSIGPLCEFLQEGDLITFGRYAPINIDTSELGYYGLNKPDEGDFEYLLLNEEDALCCVERETNEMTTEADNE